jgi:hypothetical protein
VNSKIGEPQIMDRGKVMAKQKDKKTRCVVKQNTYANPEQRFFFQIQDFHFSEGFGEKTERVKHQNERTERTIQDIFGFQVLKKDAVDGGEKRKTKEKGPA